MALDTHGQPQDKCSRKAVFKVLRENILPPTFCPQLNYQMVFRNSWTSNVSPVTLPSRPTGKPVPLKSRCTADPEQHGSELCGSTDTQAFSSSYYCALLNLRLGELADSEEARTGRANFILYSNFQLCRGSTQALFKGQL